MRRNKKIKEKRARTCVYQKKAVSLHPIFEKCGVSTSVVHRLPKPRRRVRFPYTAQVGRSIADKGKKGVRLLISLSEESPGSTEHHSG